MKKAFWITIIILLCLPLVLAYTHTDALVKESESLIIDSLSNSLGAKVEVSRISWGIMPLPHLSFEDIKAKGGHVSKLHIRLSSSALLSGNFEPTSIRADQGKINTRLLSHLIGLDTGSDGNLKIKASSINLVNDSGKNLGKFDVVVPPKGAIDIQRNKEQQIALTLKEQKGKRRDFSIKGKRWCFAMSRKPLCIDNLTAKGNHGGKLTKIDHFKGKALGGNLSGSINIKRKKRWHLDGKVNLAQVNSEQLLQLVSNGGVSGRISSKVDFSGQTDKLGGRMRGLRITGPFDIKNGVIGRANLKKAASFKSSKGTTSFSRVSGHLNYRKNSIHLAKLKLAASGLAADGHLRIAKRQLRGELDVGLKGTTGLLSVPMDVFGTTDSPKITPKPEVVAGAAAGTALLGPAGALLGTKVGSILSKGISQLKNQNSENQKHPPNKNAPTFLD